MERKSHPFLTRPTKKRGVYNNILCHGLHPLKKKRSGSRKRLNQIGGGTEFWETTCRASKKLFPYPASPCEILPGRRSTIYEGGKGRRGTSEEFRTLGEEI